MCQRTDSFQLVEVSQDKMEGDRQFLKEWMVGGDPEAMKKSMERDIEKLKQGL